LRQGNNSRLDISSFKDNIVSVITRITGKNQVTVPAEIVGKAGLKAGTRLDWRTTNREGVLEVHVMPDNVTLAAALRGRGSRFKRRDGSVVDRLHGERDLEENARTRP
jgi:bifunctional DNA-binding transcriptional regulator/antitoxin component of YhaV-PrlF toxin-antitoxin module